MTTIFYPDLSHFDLDRGVTVEPGTVAVIAKATHGTLFLDRGYPTLKQQAAAVGAIFAGYHWLNHGNATAQADYYYSKVGATPCMVDAEDEPENSGYNGPLTVQDIVDFVTRLRALGGVCNLCYLPRWFWQKSRTPDADGKVGMGSPDLTPLARLGVGLVSSNYTTYSDDGPGWEPYGGVTPVAWQYTDALPYGGSTCDFNAFRGTVDEFRALITGGTMLKDEQITLPSIDGKGTETRDAATWLGYACRDAYLGWQTAAAAKTAVDALTVKLDALAKLITNGSGNPDLAGALAHFDAGIADLKAQESATVQTLQARIDRLQAALAAAEQAAAGALTPPAA